MPIRLGPSGSTANGTASTPGRKPHPKRSELLLAGAYPVGIEAAGKNTRLSLSLGLSDRKKASVVARRLNALLLEIELLPRARMAAREQLAKISRSKARPYAPRSTTSIAAPSGLGRCEIPNNGTQIVTSDMHIVCSKPTVLNFEPGSEVREALIEAGASEDDIPAIAETFRSESEGVRADLRGQSRGRLLKDVLHRMAQVGPSDTGLNRDAASEEIFQARADAFLASAEWKESRPPHHRWTVSIGRCLRKSCRWPQLLGCVARQGWLDAARTRLIERRACGSRPPVSHGLGRLHRLAAFRPSPVLWHKSPPDRLRCGLEGRQA